MDANAVDAATMVPDNAGKPIDTAAHTDDMPAEETIGERLAQEQTDPAAEEGPPRRVTRAGAAGSGSAPLWMSCPAPHRPR